MGPRTLVVQEGEEGILLALRVRRIRLETPTLNFQNLLIVIDKEFPILECLSIALTNALNTGLILPNTFLAPPLRHLILIDFAFPIGSPLLTTAWGLVMHSLLSLRSFNYFHPNELFQRLSHLPQLEKVMIDLSLTVISRGNCCIDRS